MSSATAAQPHRVVIVGGGVAGLEALLALRALAGDYVDLTLLEPSDTFTIRALSVQDPFAPAEPHRYDLERLCDEHAVRHVHDRLRAVDLDARMADTAAGGDVPFDSLLLTLGARPAEVYPDATTFRGARDADAMRSLLRALERGEVSAVAFVVPPRTTWSLPLYELALMTAQRVRALGLDGVELTLVTPEERPLDVFGAEASEAVAAELAEAGVELVAGGYTETVRDGVVVIRHAGGERGLAVDHVVALPRLVGQAPQGVPADPEGFLVVDRNGAVRGADGVFAAGDGTDFAVKQGGIAAQQADAAAHAIARRAGVDVDLAPFRPVLRGRVLTGGGSRFLRQLLVGGGGETSTASARALWWPPSKVAAPYLAPYLERVDLRDEGFGEPRGPAPEGVDVDLLGERPVPARLGTAEPGGVHRGGLDHEVPRARWHDYLDELSSERTDARTLIKVQTDRGVVTAERGLLLRGLSYDARGDAIEVAVARPRADGEEVLHHLVEHPARVLVDSREGILPRAIAVDDVDGNRTLLQLVDDAQFTG